MDQKMNGQSKEADYEIELIATGLAAQAPSASTRGQETFAAARGRWLRGGDDLVLR